MKQPAVPRELMPLTTLVGNWEETPEKANPAF
jgi:hypothetical protein